MHLLNKVDLEQSLLLTTHKQSFGHLHLNNLKDKKAAKRIIKVAKKHPELYTREDVLYAKMVKRRIKREKEAQQNKD